MDAQKPLVTAYRGGAREAALVLLLLAFAAALRLLSIAGEAPWPDEIYATLLLDKPFGQYLNGLPRYYPSMTPVYYTLLYAWASLFGQSIVTLRLLSVAAGVLTVLSVYLVGRRIHGRGAAALAGFLVAAIAMHVQYSQEIAPYALAWLLTACSALSFLHWVEKPSTGRVLVHTACNTAMIFTHLFTVLVLPVYLLTLAFLHLRNGHGGHRRRQSLLWLALQMPPCILLGLWISGLDGAALDAGFDWVPGVGIAGAAQMLGWYTGAGGFQVREAVPDWLRAMDPLLKALSVGVFLFTGCPFVMALVQRYGRPGQKAGASHTLLLSIAWLVVPVIGLMLVSWLYRPAFVARYVGFASFGAYWVLSGVVFQWTSRAFRAWAVAMVVAIFALQAVVLAMSRPIRSDWYSVARHLEAQGPTDPVYANVYGVEYSLNAAAGMQRDVTVCDDAEQLAGQMLRRDARRPKWVVIDPLFGDWSEEAEERLQAQGRQVQRTQFNGRHAPLVVLRVE